MRLYPWADMASWLMAVDHVGRYAGSWRYMQWSTRNHGNERKTNNLGWMLYSVYAVLGVNSWSFHGEIGRDELPLCSAMMVDLWTRKREMGDEDENDMEDTSAYGKSRVRLAWLGWEDLVSVLVCARLGLISPQSGIVSWPAPEILHVPVSHDDFPHLLWSLSFLCSTLPSPKNTKLSHPALSLHAIIMS